MADKTKRPESPSGKLRTLFTPPSDEKGMVAVVIQEGTIVLDTSKRLTQRVVTQTWVVKIPEELLFTPSGDWDQQEDE